MIDEQDDIVQDEVAEATDSSVEPEVESQAEDEGQQPSEEGEVEQEELVVTIGDEKPPQREEAAAWVRELRKSHRELQKKNRELEGKLRAYVEPKVQALRKKPSLEDHDYDSAAFEGDYEKWVEEKKLVDAENSSRQQKEDQLNKKYLSKWEQYEQEKKELKIKDYEERENLIRENFSQAQQGILIAARKSPALLVAALGRNPKKLKELAEIEDLTEFTVALVELAATLKVSKRSAPPAPDKPLTGGRGSSSGGVNATLEKLRAEAERTNDYTKVNNYNRQLRQRLK